MWSRFTERAQRVIQLAQEEAVRMGHPNVGTEHILLGLVREGEGIAARALQNLGVTPEKVRREVENLVGVGHEQPAMIGFTPRMKKAIELAIDEARRLGHNYIGTEHLLLGLLREEEGVAAQVLTNLGVSLPAARQQVLQLLGQAAEGGAQGGQGSGTPTLDNFARDMTELAREGKLDPVIGREKEIERVIQVLSRRTKNNPVLIGEPGVGKTAIAEGLAERIVSNEVPETLRDKRVMALDMATVVAGTKYRGEFEDRLKKIIDEIRQNQNVILFIDELHTVIGAGGAEGAIDASNILKPALARGELQCIGATTLDEYRKYIERDPALERRFQPITVGEPTIEESIQILRGLRDRYEAHHGVKITDEALEAAVKLSARYITDRYLPDKAIDLIDEAGSRVRLRSYTAPPDLKKAEEQLEKLRQEKEAAVQAQEFEKAAELRDQERRLRRELEEKKQHWQQEHRSDELQVTADDIADIVSQWTGVPVRRLEEEESERLLHLEEVLHKRVIGQEEAISALARAIRRARAGLKDPKRPIGSFIFLGPTGVGKTELAKALAEALFGDEQAMVRIDMSEYEEKFSESRLIGAPPGYVGYEEGGQLTESVRRKPYSVVLFDEIEKAHPDIFNVLLQVLEDGRLTDGKGRTVDFRNTVIIMTSNAGAETIKKQQTLGFTTGDEAESNYEAMKSKLMEELRHQFRPEFLNRVDDIIVFHELSQDDIKAVVRLMVADVRKRLREFELDITLTDAAIDKLAEEGFDPVYGARPLRRAIQKQIEDQLSEEILRGTIHKGDLVKVDVENGKLTFTRVGQMEPQTEQAGVDA
ncbi:MAG: ATP-dependent Clp protease ATP-binding subunit [Firmicutes bacterium]|nr:ATP-dependent Clp protease ATP-binding subunit [Bacillota bacterium]